MKKFHTNSLKALAFSTSAIAFAVAAPAMAQDEGDECLTDTNAAGVIDADGDCVQTEDGPTGASTVGNEDVDVTTGASGSQAGQSGITVTGSRIVRDTYSSISPLQVISGVQQREVGAFDPSQILQRSTAASGQQIDATFQGFVLDNGPGSQTLNLRGLGADRTLVLINGRRFAPAGVEGAPTNPSINLLPSSLIDRYDLLLDGASSVYGSDAVAGVANIILRKDFDGLELYARGEINPYGSGEDFTVSGAWGMNNDRGFFGIGAEYDYRDAIRLRDREFFQGCSTHYEVTQDGEIRTTNIGADARSLRDTNGAVGLVPDDCVQFVGTGAIILDNTFSGVLFKQPGAGNFGLPGFSENVDAFGNVVDTDGDGIRDVDFQFNNLDGRNLGQLFLSEQHLINVFAYGEYTLPGAANITPYFEAMYTRAEINADNTGNSQLSPVVPASNPFNICNPNQPNGFDCGVIENQFLGLDTFAGGAFANPPGEARAVRNYFSIQGDRDNAEVVQEQYRGVLGVRGDLPFVGSSWTFDVSGIYSRSIGRSSRVGVREDRLALSLGYDPSLNPILTSFGQPLLADGPCGTAFADPTNIQPDLQDGCVPVNLFADGIYDIPFGSFSSQAEYDYLFDSRDFKTIYEQIVVSGFVTGDLFELPAGPVGLVVGAEWREDSIDSQPDVVASEGLLFGFFSDQGAVGSKTIREIYGEISLPLIAGKPLVEELNVDIAGRVTDEEFYGTNATYSIKAGWRPVSPLLLRFTYGTSFRAPNLRENFLLGQTGFLALNDPCAVPDAAFQALAGNGRPAGYQADLDERDPQILANCLREGRDPTRVGINAAGTNTDQSQSVEIRSGGSLDIDPETSTSLTAGFSFEETFPSGFEFSLGATYFDVQLRDSIVEPSSQFIINDCFLRQDGQRSPFCDRIDTDTDAANTRLLISDINNGFINLNEEAVRGIDLNATFGKDIVLFGETIDLGLNIRANHLIERSTLFIDDLGNSAFDDDAGEISLPKWTGIGTFTADISDFRFTWQVSYTGPVEQDADGIDPFSDAFGNGPDGQPTGFLGDTCTGGGSANGVVPGDGVYCRDVGFADEIFYHAASIRYRTGDLTLIAGVDNIFNTAPPLVDGNEVLSISNTIIGAGYDYDGREFFASVNFAF